MKPDEFLWVNIALCAMLAFLVVIFTDPKATQAVHDAFLYAPPDQPPAIGY